MGDGYFADGFWKDGYFAAGYWGGDGTAAPPVAPVEGDKWIGEAVIRRKPSLTLLLAAKRFFEAELGE